jgi:hypothetical protein
MKKILFFAVSSALVLGLAGCSSTPEPEPVLPKPLVSIMEEKALNICQNGGIAVVGQAESKSPTLAANYALINARHRLADRLEGSPDTEQAILDAQPTETAKETRPDADGSEITIIYTLLELDPEIVATLSAETNPGPTAPAE